MEVVYVGLGSNVNFPKTRINLAIEQLHAFPDTLVLNHSSLYLTKPWGKLDQADFINAVVKLQTKLSPFELLFALLALEQQHGRKRETRFGPRTLDCDILLYGTQEITELGLTIPHPQMQQRVFVLVPLAEIEPNLVFQGKSLSDWLSQMDTQEVKKLTLYQQEFT